MKKSLYIAQFSGPQARPATSTGMICEPVIVEDLNFLPLLHVHFLGSFEIKAQVCHRAMTFGAKHLPVFTVFLLIFFSPKTVSLLESLAAIEARVMPFIIHASVTTHKNLGCTYNNITLSSHPQSSRKS